MVHGNAGVLVCMVLQADTNVVLEQMNVWCQCMHGVAGTVAGSALLLHAALPFRHTKL